MAGLAAWFAAAAVAAVLIGRMIARRDRQRPQEAERPSAAPRPDRADEVPVAEADLATKDP